MNNFYFKKNKILYLLFGLIFTSTIENTFAEEIFNPAFLTDGHSSDIIISDLSKFNQKKYQPPGVYRVEILVNNEKVDTEDVVFIENYDEQGNTFLLPCLDAEKIKSFGIIVVETETDSNAMCMDFLSRIPGSTSDFIFDKQKLKLTFPQVSIRNNVRGYISPERWDNGINAFYTSYTVSLYNNSYLDSKSVFLNFNNGFNIGSWQFRNNSFYNYNESNDLSSSRFNSINTYVKRNIIPLKSKILIGESNTSNEIFDSLRFLGLNLSSAEEMYPDSQQGYAPTIRGVAQSNANVVIKQNNSIIYQISVPPGPFLIEDLNPTSVSGDLTVEINEANGTIQSFVVPYSTLPILQRDGRLKYDAVIGKYKTNSANSLTPRFLQGTLIYGLPHGISVYGGMQFSKDYSNVLLGLGRNLGKLGAVSFDVSHANSEFENGVSKSGQSVRFLYAKSLVRTGTTFRLLGYRYSTEGFFTFNEVLNQLDRVDTLPLTPGYFSKDLSRKGQFEANISHSFGKYGSLFLSGTQQSYWKTGLKNSWLQAGHSVSYRGVNLSLSLSHFSYKTYGTEDTILSFGASLPLDNLARKNNKARLLENAYVTASTTHSSETGDDYRVALSGTLLENRNLRYSLSQSQLTDHSNAGSLALDYKGRFGDIGGTYSYNKNSNQIGLNGNGSILAHRNGVTFGQYMNETSILVEAKGAAGVSIENYPGIKTNSFGHAVIPYASAYRENRVSLNPNSFDNNVEIERNVNTVIPANGAIVRTVFKADIGIRALITLSKDNKHVPYLSTVTELDSSIAGIVGIDGGAFLTGLPRKGTLEVTWGSGAEAKCIAEYDTTEMNVSVQPVIQLDVNCE
ncbi:fimbria/pilus outer membrane usher protein [Acinetobacter pullicarnis]|uniref:fimbria/pilus outer membrane usher protein n=1 Tax=Acinetobacter pullicarnis TaxID=2576829 RepID=UPI001121838F|nr:fimbria/pilus outer membrane usher protein [Acinetobacter pullicarnis]